MKRIGEVELREIYKNTTAIEDEMLEVEGFCDISDQLWTYMNPHTGYKVYVLFADSAEPEEGGSPSYLLTDEEVAILRLGGCLVTEGK